MPHIEYRDYLIVSNADTNTTNGRWKPLVCISWTERGNKADVHFLHINEEYTNSDSAVQAGFDAARAWVDRRMDIHPRLNRTP